MTAPIAVGLDLVDVARVRSAMERTPGFVERVFTTAEAEYSRSAADPAERFAARWAAKEAVAKCLGGGVPGFDLRDIEVVRGENGAPSIRLAGQPARRAAERGVVSWLVSMSHTASVAEAIAIALGGTDVSDAV